MSRATEVSSSVLGEPSEYDRFASVYDGWLAKDFCKRAFPAIERLLLSGIPAGGRILDLCCGTGQIARELSSNGYDVMGIDASPEMIRIAQSSVSQAKFICCDAREIKFQAEFDATVSAFNSLAHFDDLTRIFRQVRKALRPRAPFLFDLSMEEAYVSKWVGSFALVADQHACIVSPSYDSASRIGTNLVTLFQLQSGTWQRSDFEIKQKCHTMAVLRSALQTAGYDNVQTYDAERDLGISGEAGRMFFLCR